MGSGQAGQPRLQMVLENGRGSRQLDQSQIKDQIASPSASYGLADLKGRTLKEWLICLGQAKFGEEKWLPYSTLMSTPTILSFSPADLPSFLTFKDCLPGTITIEGSFGVGLQTAWPWTKAFLWVGVNGHSVLSYSSPPSPGHYPHLVIPWPHISPS